jgi:putative nucleotidyltransferase with HDIG domain
MSDLATGQIPVEWLPLLALTAGAGLITLRVPGMPVSFSISDTFTIMATLVVGPSAGALTAAVDGLVLSYRIPRRARSADRVSFNVACLSLATWTAGTVYHALSPGSQAMNGVPGALQMLGALALFGGLHFALNSGLVALAVAFERGLSFTAVWKEHFRDLWISSFGGTFAGMLMIALGRQNVVEALILVTPLPIVLYVALRHALGRAEDRIDHLGKMNKVYVATIEALAQAVDAKDQVTHDHVRRVQEKSLRLAERLGVHDSGQLQALHAAGLLHDVGKIGIPEHILNKPGRLTAPEFEIMKRHPAIGADILSVIGFPYPLIPIVRHHHENWDGTGYPDGLAGEQIPIGARILQVVDCFDALTSDRPYRAAMSDADALKIVAERRGTMYDPKVVDALLELLRCEPPSEVKPVSAPPAPAVDPPPPPVAAPTVTFAIDGLESAVENRRSPALIGDALWTRLRVHIPASAIVLFVCDGQELLASYRAGERTLAPGSRIAVGQRVSGWVASSGRIALNSDARLDFEGDLREQTPLRSTLAVPMRRDGETIGVLALYAEREDAFTDGHAAIASAAAVAAARALTNPMQEGAAVAV